MPPQMGPGNRNHGRFEKQQKPKNIRSSISRLFKYVDKDKWLVIVAFLCVIISCGTNLAATYMLKPIINNLTANMPVAQKVADLLIGVMTMAGIYLAGVVASFIQSRTMIRVSQHTIKRIRADLFTKLQDMSVR